MDQRSHGRNQNAGRVDPDLDDKDHHHLWKHKTWSTSRITTAKTEMQDERRPDFNEKGDEDDFDRGHHELWEHRERSTSRITTHSRRTTVGGETQEHCSGFRFGPDQLERICAEKAKHCYKVVNGLFEIMTGEYIVARLLKYEGRPDVSADTVVRLVPPKGVEENLDLCYRDYYNWTLDHSYLPAEYMAGMIASMFVLSSLSLESSDSSKQVLVIGAGAGGMDMALHGMKPHVNITGVDIDELILKIGKNGLDLWNLKLTIWSPRME